MGEDVSLGLYRLHKKSPSLHFNRTRLRTTIGKCAQPFFESTLAAPSPISMSGLRAAMPVVFRTPDSLGGSLHYSGHVRLEERSVFGHQCFASTKKQEPG